MGIRKMTFEQRRLVSSCFLALVACFYLNQPIEAFGLQGFPTGAIGYPGLRSGLGSTRMITKGNCADFTREECHETNHRYASDHMKDLYKCKQRCRKETGIESGSDECIFFVWKKDSIGHGGDCERYNYAIKEHDKSCDHFGGPTLPSVDECGAVLSDANKNCSVETETDCFYEDPLTPGHNVPSIQRCQSDCLDEDECKFFLFDKDKKICKKYASTKRTCKKIRGPPRAKLEGCPKVSVTIPRPSDFEGQCPPPSVLAVNVDGSFTCCCSSGCCFDKCTNERPDYECIESVPNSQWIKNELGYWQTKQYKSQLGFNNNQQSTTIRIGRSTTPTTAIISTSQESSCKSSSTCNGKGTCNSDGSCSCYSNYYGSDCSKYCDDLHTCHGNGYCTADGSCSCKSGYIEDDCSWTYNSPAGCFIWKGRVWMGGPNLIPLNTKCGWPGWMCSSCPCFSYNGKGWYGYKTAFDKKYPCAISNCIPCGKHHPD